MTYIHNKLLAVIALIFALFLTVNAQNNSLAGLFISTSFTPEGSFTSGVEGPAVDRSGNVYAVNYNHQGTIGKVEPDGTATLFVELPKGSIGNGIRFDSRGNMFIADYTMHNILKVDMSTRVISVFAHESSMGQPNDLAIDRKDRLYASDPNNKTKIGAIWRIDPDGKMTLLDTLRGFTNGIEVSPNNKILYINVSPRVYAYDLSPDGEIGKRRVFIEFPKSGMDGMRCDIKGNLYITRFGLGIVVKVSPEGKVLQEIPLLGKKCTNLAFGGKDGKTVYVTLMDKGNIESFRTDIPGNEWEMQKKVKIK